MGSGLGVVVSEEFCDLRCWACVPSPEPAGLSEASKAPMSRGRPKRPSAHATPAKSVVVSGKRILSLMVWILLFGYNNS